MTVSPSASLTDKSVESNMHPMHPHINFKCIESKSFKNLTRERTQTPVIRQDRSSLSLTDTSNPIKQMPTLSKWGEIAKKALIAISILTFAIFAMIELRLTIFDLAHLISGTFTMLVVYAIITMIFIPGSILALGLGLGLTQVNCNL